MTRKIETCQLSNNVERLAQRIKESAPYGKTRTHSGLQVVGDWYTAICEVLYQCGIRSAGSSQNPHQDADGIEMYLGTWGRILIVGIEAKSTPLNVEDPTDLPTLLY